MDWKAGEKHKSKLKRFTKLYAQMLFNNDIDARKLMNVYDRTEQQPEIKLKRLLRSKTVQDQITSEIIELYKSNGITPDKVIKEEMSLLETAKSKEDLANAIKIVSNWRESLEFKPKQTTSTHTQTNYLSYIDKDRGKITAKQTKQLKQSDKDE